MQSDEFRKAYSDANIMTVAMNGSFIAGSALIDYDNAKDVDVVVSHGVWLSCMNQVIQMYGLVVETKEDGEDKYEEVSELVYTYRTQNGLINLLVVDDKFYAAYRAAAYQMISRPSYFKTRERRIWLHQKLKNRIRIWFDIEQKTNEDYGFVDMPELRIDVEPTLTPEVSQKGWSYNG